MLRDQRVGGVRSVRAAIVSRDRVEAGSGPLLDVRFGLGGRVDSGMSWAWTITEPGSWGTFHRKAFGYRAKS